MNRGRRPRNGNGEDFYSQMASIAGDFDSSEADSSGTDLNPKSPAKLDVDNLDSNLFSSLKATSTNRAAAIGSPSTSKPVAKETAAGKKSKGVDMGELSRLLGTEDIMKDLSSSNKKPATVVGLKPLQPAKPPDTQIKKEADDLLDLLSSTFDDSNSKTAKPKVDLSTKPDQDRGKTQVEDNILSGARRNSSSSPNITKKSETESVRTDIDYKDSQLDKSGNLTFTRSNQLDAESVTNGNPITSSVITGKPAEVTTHKSSSLKSPVSEKKPPKTAATVNFDSDDDDDDLLADLGLDDNSNSTKTTSSKKSVRFSEDIESSVAQPPELPSQKQLQESTEQEKLELPKFPWQKKPQQQNISAPKQKQEGVTNADQVGTEKLEPPKFPWQKTPQSNTKRKSSFNQDTSKLGDLLPTPEDKSGALALELGDPFAKKPARCKSSSQSEVLNESQVKTEILPAPASIESSMQGLLDLGDPFAKKTHKPRKPKAESPEKSKESVLDLGDPFAKNHKKATKPEVELPNQSLGNALELDSQFDRKSITSPRSGPQSVQKQPPEDLLQFDDPFVKKTRNRPARAQTSPKASSSPSNPDEGSSIGMANTSPQNERRQPGLRKGSLDVGKQGRAGSGDEGVRMEDLQQALKRAREAEEALEKERLDHAKSKRLLMEAEAKLQLSSSELERWKQEAESYRSNISETEATKKTIQEELTAKLRETTLSLQKTEMEHSHAQQQLETLKKRHEEEIESLKQSYSIRITHLEESVSLTENRLKEELKLELARGQEKLEYVEKERSDAIQKLQKEIQALEVAKTQDINMLKDMYKSTIENLKNDHEADKQQLSRRHMEAVQAIKDAQLHSRTLLELKSKVESSSKMVTELQAKLAQEHDQFLEERAQRNRTQENQLKVMEERLFQQQTENESERGRLQGLVAKMEARLSQQDRSMEQERWTLHQEQAKLKAQQSAFREEQVLSRNRLEEDRNQFQLTREQFLVEQQDILSKCYKEQQKIAMEKAEASFRKKKAEDYEMSSRQLSEQTMAEREVSMSHLNEELLQVEVEKKKLSKLEEDLKIERRLLDTEKEKLRKFTDDVCSRSKEVDIMCQDATEMKSRGEKELKEAQQLQKEIQNQQESLREELANLRKKEIHISEEQLELLEQRKKFEEQLHKASLSLETSSQCRNHLEPFTGGHVSVMDLTPIPAVRDSVKLPVIENGRHVYSADQPQSLYSSLSVAPSSPPPRRPLSTKLSLPLMQSSVIQQPVPPVPKSPAHTRQNSSRLESSRSTTPEKTTSIQAYLQQLEHNVYARKDYEELEKQKMFLASLSKSQYMKL